MNPMRDYDISFVGLKEGIHYFDFKIDSSFFRLFENAPLQECDINVKLKFDKQINLFLLQFEISGTIHTPCNRCSTFLDFPIDADMNVVVKLGSSIGAEKDNEEDVVYISSSETHYNVAQLIYEFIILSIPENRIDCTNLAGEKKCDNEMLRILEDLKEKKENTELDPRWDSLKKIKFK